MPILNKSSAELIGQASGSPCAPDSALDATRFLKLPPDRVVEVGSLVEI